MTGKIKRYFGELRDDMRDMFKPAPEPVFDQNIYDMGITAFQAGIANSAELEGHLKASHTFRYDLLRVKMKIREIEFKYGWEWDVDED